MDVSAYSSSWTLPSVRTTSASTIESAAVVSWSGRVSSSMGILRMPIMTISAPRFEDTMLPSLQRALSMPVVEMSTRC